MSDVREFAYATAALESEAARLAATPSGRACAAFISALKVGSLLEHGGIDRDAAEKKLLEAAVATGLSEREARRNIRSGLAQGAKSPREIPQGSRRAVTHKPSPPRTPAPRVEELVARPPATEVEALWVLARPISSDEEADAWFRRRFAARADTILDLVEFWNLTRVLPAGASIPRWCWSPAGKWSVSGHRLVFRLWDDNGRAVSIRARSLRLDTELKAVAPSGFSIRGLVLADPLGVQMLSGAALSWWEPQVIVSEGEPDWITWGAQQNDARADGPAYIGIDAGAWSDAIARRIPDGARVSVRTHHDVPGERYAAEIIRSLRGRCAIYRGSGDAGGGR